MIDLLENLPPGPSRDLLLEYGGDPGILRPYRWKDGKSYITLGAHTGSPRTVVSNAPATLSYDAWKVLDDTVLRALYQPQRAWRDLREMGMVYRPPGGMGTAFLQYTKVGDTNPATVSMKPVRRGESDRPEADTALHPIPFVHKDFDFDVRELLQSRAPNSVFSLDTTMITQSTTKIGEALEEMTFGVRPLTLGGVRLYGYTDLPERATKTDFTVPTGTNGGTTLNEILALRQLLIDDKHYGPFKLYMNRQWAQYLDTDFSTSKGDNTLRQRILQLADISAVEVNQWLPATNYAMVLVEMSELVTRAVITVDLTVVQWETLGGMNRHWKVFMCASPQVRPDQGGNSGVAHGTSATA
jgi:hypothetical protein